MKKRTLNKNHHAFHMYLAYIASDYCNAWSNEKSFYVCAKARANIMVHSAHIIIFNQSIDLSSIMCEMTTVDGCCVK